MYTALARVVITLGGLDIRRRHQLVERVFTRVCERRCRVVPVFIPYYYFNIHIMRFPFVDLPAAPPFAVV